MYRIIVADDEQVIRDRLVGLLSAYDDVEIVGVFENGYDALEAVEGLSPDIIITDVKMPFVDGLTLIQEAKAVLPLLQGIVISGFDSFDYAKKAIGLGVVGYLSKPLDKDELDEVLRIAKNNLVEQSDYQSLRDGRERLGDELLRSDIRRLLGLRQPDGDLLGKLQEAGVSLRGYCHVLAIDYDEPSPSVPFDCEEATAAAIQEGCSEVFGDCSTYLVDMAPFGVILLFSNEHLGKADLQKRASRLIAYASRMTGCSLSCGVSEEGKGKDFSYRKLYRHAAAALEYRDLLGGGLVLFHDDLGIRPSVKLDENEYRTLSSYLSSGDEERTRAFLERVVGEVGEEASSSSYHLILGNLLDTLLRGCHDLDGLYSSFISYAEMRNRLEEHCSPSSATSLLSEVASKIIALNGSSKSEGLELSFKGFMDYLNKNYTKTDLCLTSMAGDLGYSISYVSAIFRRNGNSFTKALNEIRMKKAGELLLDENRKLGEVARMVGFDDPYYFSHCYKRYYGYSPRKKK